jgi:hypothetical protein
MGDAEAHNTPARTSTPPHRFILLLLNFPLRTERNALHRSKKEMSKKKTARGKGEETARCLRGITASQGVVVYP